MSEHKRSPIIKLALPQFRRRFGDLLHSQSSITIFERSLLQAIYEQIMWFGRNQNTYIDFERTARTGYHFLNQGSTQDYDSVVKQMVITNDKIIPAINYAMSAKSKAEQSPDDSDQEIIEYLQYYKTLYERLLPVILAPVVYAFSIFQHIDNSLFMPRRDGKINLASISKMNQYLSYGENRLARGLNGHLRNAFSHEYYTILDDAQVQLWDINPWTKKYSWGPEVWRLDQLVTICDQLWVNSLGITCALAIYYVNNLNMIACITYDSRPKIYHLRRKELAQLIAHITDELGFYLRDVSTSTNSLSITLLTKTKGKDQDAQLMLGYKEYTQLFKIPTWYEQTRVINQLNDMLFLLTPYFNTQTEIFV